MVKAGDVIIAAKKGMDWDGVEMVVTDTELSSSIKLYVDGEIRAEDQWQQSYILKRGEYRLKTKEDDRVFRIYPIKRDNGTRQPFYHVVEDNNGYVTFFDDNKAKRHVPKDKVKEFTSEDTLDGIYQLSKEMLKLKQAFAETFEALKNESGEALNKLNK